MAPAAGKGELTMRELDMKLEWIRACGDASDDYHVVLSEECTVREFVEYALNKKGNNFRIEFWCLTDSQDLRGWIKPVCEFINGTVQYMDAMERYGDAMIGDIRANSGYGQRIYRFKLKEV